jgi:hypothetical protein
MRLLVLLRNESRKTLHRLAFWVTFLFFGFVVLVDQLENMARTQAQPDRYDWTLPGAWADGIGGMGQPALFFSAVILLLLIASEFSWRTARQNVIDGLSKSQFFVGKLLLLPMMVGVFVGFTVLSTGLTAYFATDMAAFEGPLIQPTDWVMMGAFATAVLLYGSMALFAATAIRSSGPAMGVWFLWLALVEQMLPSVVNKIRDGWGPAMAPYQPGALGMRLLDNLEHDPAALQAAAVRAMEAGDPIPTALPGLWPAAWTWIAVLLLVSYILFRKRDL